MGGQLSFTNSKKKESRRWSSMDLMLVFGVFLVPVKEIGCT